MRQRHADDIEAEPEHVEVARRERERLGEVAGIDRHGRQVDTDRRRRHGVTHGRHDLVDIRLRLVAAELEALRLKFVATQGEQAALVKEKESLFSRIRDEYDLNGTTDGVNLTTGAPSIAALKMLDCVIM